MRIPIVNEQDEIIGYKEREETTSEDICRVSRLNVFNKKGEVLVSKRQSTKKIDPNCWGPSVAGTVEEGETYESNIVKEAEEEIGLKNIKPIFFKKIFYKKIKNPRFTSVYYVFIDLIQEKNLILQEEEVSEMKWINIEDLKKWFNERPDEFIPSFSRTLENIKEIYESKN